MKRVNKRKKGRQTGGQKYGKTDRQKDKNN
jgi:hypothetical protein